MSSRSADLIAPTLQKLKAEFGYQLYSAAEIEFTLHGSSDKLDATAVCYRQIVNMAQQAGIHVQSIEAEKGVDQHELSLMICDDACQTAEHICHIKSIISTAADAQQLKADFSAKPLASEPGNGLHVHIHIGTQEHANLFFKDDHTISDELKYSIGGLLEWLNPSMAIFAPTTASYARFTSGNNAPTTVSWGANNRTVAIRLPDSDHHQKHIEHRVAGSDSDPILVMAVIVAAIHYGLTHRITPSAQIYGDASLDMYELPVLAQSHQEAMSLLKNFSIMAEYFTDMPELLSL